MTKVEQLAQEQFNTFKTRLCEILCEIEEEHKSAFIQGYAKGETDEKFRTKQVVTKENAELKRDYYADRPTEPYSDDDNPNDWANIAHYAEENLEKAFKRISDLEKELENVTSIAAHQQSSNMKRYFEIKDLKKKNAERLDKVKSTLKKIIETVQNDRIDEYGARLVLIKDFAYECLEEIEK